MTDERDPLDDDEDEGEGTTDDSADGESKGGKDPDSSEKRIRDLQSAKDKETARANKAESALKKVLDAANPSDAGAGKPPEGGNVANDAILDMARMFAFQQNPKLAEYGIQASDLNGDSPSAIAETAVELVARYEKIATVERNKVLAEHGLAPEIDGSAPPPPSRDYSQMPKDEFNKVLDAALNKGR